MLDYDFTKDVSGAQYRQLLDGSLCLASIFAFVVRKPVLKKNTQVVASVERLRPIVDHEVRANRWPGNRTRGYGAIVFSGKFDKKSVDVLAQESPSLFSWGGDRPEDLHLLRASGEAFLTNVAHERMAWLTMSASEFATFSRRAPGVAASLRMRAD